MIVFLFFLSLQVRADLTNMYGFGPVSAGLAGSDRAYSSDGFTINKNPALMSLSDQAPLSLGFFGTYDQFDDLENVVIDNTEVGSSTGTVRGKVDTDVPDAFNFLVGAVWVLSERPSKPRLGVSISVPMQRLMEPATKDIYQPQYAMYLSDAQRLTLNMAASIKVADTVSLGAGAHYYLSQGATVSGRLPSPPSVSTMNMKMDVRPVLAPMVGFAWQPNENHIFVLNYSGVRDARLSMKTEEVIVVGGSTIPMIFNANASLWYDPEVWSAAYSVKASQTRLYFAADYERWSGFDGAILKLEFDGFGGWTQNRPDTKYKDIWVSRIGVSHDLDTWTWRAGYAWRPSPTPDLKLRTNFLDSDRHVVALGVSKIVDNFLGIFDKPVRLDSHVQAHLLVPRQVTKDDPNSIGGPGYTVRGTMWSYSLALTMGL